MSGAPEPPEDDDAHLGAAAEIPFEEGRAVALLIDARLRLEYLDTRFGLGDDEKVHALVRAVLVVPRFLVDRFNDEVSSEIHDALAEAARA